MLTFVLQLFVFSCVADKTNNLKPVVLVPGILSSTLYGDIDIQNSKDVPSSCTKNKNNVKLWFRFFTSIRASVFKHMCIYDYMKTIWDNNSNPPQQHNIHGVRIEPPKFGKTFALKNLYTGRDPKDKLWYKLVGITQKTSTFRALAAFNKIVEEFKKMGYIDGDNMKGYPYDWRYFTFDTSYNFDVNYYEAVKNSISNLYNKYHKKVVIISHSMGGLITYKFLDYVGKQFCNDYIDMWIPISAPWLGAVKALDAVTITRYSLPRILRSPVIYSLAKNQARKLTRSIETIPFLFPNEGKDHYWNGIVMTKEGQNYSVKDIPNIIKMVPDPDGNFFNMANYTYYNGFNKLMTKHNYTFPYGVETHCIYSVTKKKETLKSIIVEKDFDEGKIDKEDGEGDETVNIESLKFCEILGDINNVTVLDGPSHTDILSSNELINELKKYIYENSDSKNEGKIISVLLIVLVIILI